MMNEPINLTWQELDIPIYRVFGIDRLFEILSSRKNTLVRPKLWDDPLENFILEQAIETSQNPKAYIVARDGFYGQCWSTLKESDAMWRIYSPNKNGVKVKTTAKKLYNSLCRSLETNEENCFIGKVDYMKGDELKDNLENPYWRQMELGNLRRQAGSLLFKREEFEHEAEIRLLYCSETRLENIKLFHYQVDPCDLFDEIVFDPRLHEDVYEAYKYYLKEKLDFSKTIQQSELYKLPQIQKNHRAISPA